jgi:hypothetical protein
VQVDAREVVLLLSQSGLGGSSLICAGRLNVAERDELLQDRLGGGRIRAQIGGMHSTFARFRLPAGNARDRRRLFEGLHQNAAVHVFAHGQSEQGQDVGVTSSKVAP